MRECLELSHNPMTTQRLTGSRRINDKLGVILKGVGIKVGRQNYTYHSAGEEFSGENLYGILQAPRGDATEAIVLVAAWTSIEGALNRNGVALALTLARYFKRRLDLATCVLPAPSRRADKLGQAGPFGPRTSLFWCPRTAGRVPRPGSTRTTMPTIRARLLRSR